MRLPLDNRARSRLPPWAVWSRSRRCYAALGHCTDGEGRSRRFAPCEPRSAGYAKTYAVEMTRGGKLQKRVFHRAWKSGRRRRIPTFPPRQQQHLFLFPQNSVGLPLIKLFDGCRSLRSRSIRQRRFAPIVTGISPEQLTGIKSESVTAIVGIGIQEHFALIVGLSFWCNGPKHVGKVFGAKFLRGLKIPEFSTDGDSAPLARDLRLPHGER
jgi:hypothetical protein